MPETLFGYTVEEDNGGLVITVRGSLAESAVRQLRERLENDGRLPVLSLLSPLVPIGRLLSTGVQIQSERAGIEQPQIDERALSQQIDQSYSEFRQQLDEFRKAVRELKPELPTRRRKTRASSRAEPK